MPTRRARIRRRVYAMLPEWLKNHDFEVFAAVLGVFAGFPILLGQVQPSSPEDLLPRPVVFLWALTLVLGGMTILVALIFSSRVNFPARVFWMRMEALGLTAVAYFCYVYAICIMTIAIRSGWPAALLVLAFGCVSHVREASIHDELETYRKSLGLRGKA